MPPKRSFYSNFGGINDNENNLLQNLFKKPPKEKRKEMNRFENQEPDAIHQADLLFLPNDKGYKYMLVVTDKATRKTDIEPLKEKNASTVLEAIKNIYDRNILSWPKFQLQTDSGSEFKGEFAKFFKDKNIIIRTAKAGRHRQQGIVENMNKIIGKAVFLDQTAQELLTNEQSTKWVNLLPKLREKLNEYFEKPVKEINLKKDPFGGVNPVDILSEGTKVRIVLDQPKGLLGENLSGKFREGDIRWDKTERKIEQVLFHPSQPPMYLVTGYPHTPYARKQLQLIQPNEKLPNRSVLEVKKEVKPKKAPKKKEEPKKKATTTTRSGRKTNKVDYVSLAGKKKKKK